jgi:hypothetical protein
MAIITQQTEESKRMGEILKNLKLGCVSSKDSSDADAIDIDNIPERVVINGFGEVLGEVLINTISAAAD